MNKFSFTVDLVGKDLDTAAICDMLKSAIDGVTDHECVEFSGTKTLTEQGFKVWAKRKCGISYATKKTKERVAEQTMKPIIGIGSNTKFGRVLKILRDGVVVENGQGQKDTVSFRKIENSLKGK